MNLFEAKHLLQSVGYNVSEKSNKWVEMDCLVESIVRGLRKPMLNEMGQAAGFMQKYGDERTPALKVIRDLDSIRSARSNYRSGKSKSTSVAKDAGKVTEYLEDFDTIKSMVEDDGNSEPDVMVAYNSMLPFYDAVMNDDLRLIKDSENKHGAKDGMDFNAAIAAKDLDRAYACLKNSVTSGGSQTAIDRCKAKLAQIRKLPDAKKGDMKAKLDALEAKIDSLEPSSRAGRNAGTFTVTFDPAKARVVNVILNKLGINANGDAESGEISFTASPVKGKLAAEKFERIGATVTQQERVAAARSTEKVTNTYGIVEDDVDIIDMLLGDNKNVSFSIDGDTLSITGTALQIGRAIEDLKANGVELA